jgi:hypothetical protein
LRSLIDPWNPPVTVVCRSMLHVECTPELKIGLFVPKPSPCIVALRCWAPDLGASVHRHTLAAGGIVTQLVTRPHPEPLYFRAAQPCPDPLLARSLAWPGLIRFAGAPESADIRARWCQPWVSSDEADVRRRLMLWWTAPEIALASMTVGARRDWGRNARWWVPARYHSW